MENLLNQICPVEREDHARMGLVLVEKNRKVQQNLFSRNLIDKLGHIFDRRKHLYKPEQRLGRAAKIIV
jgi:hypothetical protein